MNIGEVVIVKDVLETWREPSTRHLPFSQKASGEGGGDGQLLPVVLDPFVVEVVESDEEDVVVDVVETAAVVENDEVDVACIEAAAVVEDDEVDTDWIEAAAVVEDDEVDADWIEAAAVEVDVVETTAVVKDRNTEVLVLLEDVVEATFAEVEVTRRVLLAVVVSRVDEV
jgi:hypothetical protein